MWPTHNFPIYSHSTLFPHEYECILYSNCSFSDIFEHPRKNSSFLALCHQLCKKIHPPGQYMSETWENISFFCNITSWQKKARSDTALPKFDSLLYLFLLFFASWRSFVIGWNSSRLCSFMPPPKLLTGCKVSDTKRTQLLIPSATKITPSKAVEVVSRALVVKDYKKGVCQSQMAFSNTFLRHCIKFWKMMGSERPALSV